MRITVLIVERAHNAKSVWCKRARICKQNIFCWKRETDILQGLNTFAPWFPLL